MVQEVKVIDSLLDFGSFNYVRNLLKSKYKTFSYDSYFGRYSVSDYDYPEMRTYLSSVEQKAKKIFNSDTLKKTYILFAHYEGTEAELLPHKDDNACTYTLDLCLYQNTPWPLYVEGKEYTLGDNQALAFYGEDQEHWRSKFPNPETNQVGMLFLHYAEPDHWFFKRGINEMD